MSKSPKIALVHDYIKEFGGAEKVLETLHDMFPNAPIFTTVYLPRFLGPHRSRIEKWDIRPSWLQGLPFKAKLISPIRMIAPKIFAAMNFNDYDVVIVSATGAYSPNMITKGKAVHICYMHTPPRYLYGYETARKIKKDSLIALAANIVFHFLRLTDYDSAQKPDYFIANSQEVAQRIEKFYRRDALVINPPIEIPKSFNKTPVNQRKYYIAGGRLSRAKRIDLAIKAVNKLNLPLKIFGRTFAGYGDKLHTLAGPTVEFVGEITEQEKWGLFAGAKAYLSPADNEDFGMLNVEVMATGTPVIAHASGGALETVIDGKTGILFPKLTTRSLVTALKKFDQKKIKPSACRVQAKKFSKEKFEKQILRFIEKHA